MSANSLASSLFDLPIGSGFSLKDYVYTDTNFFQHVVILPFLIPICLALVVFPVLVPYSFMFSDYSFLLNLLVSHGHLSKGY